MVDGPLGKPPLLYADYAASGRALREVEDFLREHVLPVYANPHKQASYYARAINALRRAARAEVARLCGAGVGDAAIFSGSGATVLDKLAAAGGGTVSFVSPGGHDYLADLAAREEAGTPFVIGDIRTVRAAMVRPAMIEAGLDQRAQVMCDAALDRWRGNPRIEVLGRAIAWQVPIVAFRIRDAEGALVHHQRVTRILSDCLGIQARGGWPGRSARSAEQPTREGEARRSGRAVDPARYGPSHRSRSFQC